MSLINADTARFDSLLADFDICIKTYNESISTFFSTIIKDEGWTGDASDEYSEKAQLEKTKYENFGASLVKFSDVLHSISKELASNITSSKG